MHAAADLAQSEKQVQLQHHGAVEGALAGKGSHASRTRRGHGDLSGDCRGHAQGRAGRGRCCCCCLDSCCVKSRTGQAADPSGATAVDPAAAASQPAAPKPEPVGDGVADAKKQGATDCKPPPLKRLKSVLELKQGPLEETQPAAPAELELQTPPARRPTSQARARVINDCFSRLSS